MPLHRKVTRSNYSSRVDQTQLLHAVWQCSV